MAFWGVEVKPGKAVPFVPPPEGSKLHLSQACLSTKAKPGAKAALKVRVSDEGTQLLVCSLREGGAECLGLDLIFDQYTEFTVEGGASIHLTGYYMPEYELGGEEEESEEEDGYGYGPGQILGYDENGVPVLAGEYDSEEDSDYETEDEEEDEELGSDSDLNPPRRIVIEDVTDADRRAALPAPEQANGLRVAEFSDSDVEASDEDEEEAGSEEEEGSEDQEEGSGEEEEEESSGEEGSGSEDLGSEEEAATAVKAAQAGQKRKAEQPPSAAKQQPKQAKQAGAATPAAAGKQQQGAAPAGAAQREQGAAPATAGKQQQQAAGKAATPAKKRTFPNGFEIEDLKMGRPDGQLAKAGKKVVVRYVGRVKASGKVFDQTKGNATFGFRLGVGEVIKGWDRGVEGMRVGDKRRLTIPPAMAYGSSGVRGTIPPNSTLVFEVELVNVK